VAEVQTCSQTTKKGSQCTRKSVPGASTCGTHGGNEEAEEWIAGLGDGVELVTSDELERAREVRRGVMASIEMTEYSWLLGDSTEKEVSYSAYAVLIEDHPGYRITLEHEPGAIAVQCRCDIRAPRLICDLKGCGKKEDLLPYKWQWKIHNFSMHIQGALYADIVAAVEREGKTAFGWLAHMTSEPYAVRIFTMSDIDRERGRCMVAEGLRRWKHYYDTGDPWLGWPTKLEEVSRPYTVLRQEEEEKE
jgi:hypothetical protein